MTEEIMQPDTFRILVIGKANAGKTTILRAVCGAEGEPDVYDERGKKVRISQRSIRSALRTTMHSIRARLLRGAPDSVLVPLPPAGLNPGPSLHLGGISNSILSPSSLRGEHNIEYSLMFRSSPGFVFHDSRGFESGAVEELELVREFIQKKASLGSMKNQLHAIWYCISTDGNRFMTAAEKQFFDTIDTGSVPVIAIFTKFDALDAAAFSALSDQGVPFAEAQMRAPEHAQAQFNQDLSPLIKQLAHPPRAVVCLRNMNKGSPDFIQKAASELIEKTSTTLDDSALKILLVQAQCVNVRLCMKAAVNSEIITKAAQNAFQEDPVTFNPIQKELIKQIFKWFPYIWAVNDLTEDHTHGYNHKHEIIDNHENNLNYLADGFIQVITPLISSHLHSISPPLQVLSVGCAAVIVAAKAFWMQPGDTRPHHIASSFNHYMESGAAEDVKVAILKAFQDAPRPYDTSEGKAALLEVVLNNQMSHAS